MHNRTYTIHGYEWNPAKARSNSTKHGVRLADAVAVLEDDMALTIEDHHSDEEVRFATLGMDALGRILVVVHTPREERTRLISARRANRSERARYRSGARKGPG